MEDPTNGIYVIVIVKCSNKWDMKRFQKWTVQIIYDATNGIYVIVIVKCSHKWEMEIFHKWTVYRTPQMGFM